MSDVEQTPAAPEPSAPPPPPSDAGLPTPADRQMAMFAHLSALLGGLLTAAAGGWGAFIGPLIIWLVKKDSSAYIDEQGKEALNFNITVAIIWLGLFLFTLMTLGFGALVAVPIWVITGIAWLVLTIVAAIKVNDGEHYRYPVSLRLIK